MKKLVFAAATLMVLAGASITVPTVSNSAKAALKGTTPATKFAAIPPPGCPMHDPNGCGIYD